MGTGVVVLIAENDQDMRAYVRRCVERHDLTIGAILEAADGREALELARDRPVDLIITDGAMPHLDGFALCSALRATRRGDRVAILVITGAYGFREATRRARAAGADGLLLKPFNALTLCEKIDEVLRARPPPGSRGAAGDGRRGEGEDDEEDETVT